MRAFMILAFIAVACARPNNGLNGYNYATGGSASNYQPTYQQQPQQSLFQPSSQNGLLPSASSDFLQQQQQPQQSLNVAPQPQEPLITKQFYIHSAPEDTEIKNKHFVLGRAQKNYRVVFIKAPSSGNGNVKLSAEYAPQEEKTHIYVLTQKEHELDANDIATPAPTQPSKPEVFFIKYKTPEEAAHAQREIQSQYDSLGGSSQVSDEGTAPVSSVVGALGNNNNGDDEILSASNLQNSQIGGNYLPPPSPPVNSGYLPPSHY